MSQYMISAHGGGKVARTQRDGSISTGMLVENTMAGVREPVHMKQMDFLVSNTTGVPRNSSVLDGVLQDTTTGSATGHHATSEVMKSHEHFATKQGPMGYGQVPYAEAMKGPKIIGKNSGNVKRGEHEKNGMEKEEDGTKTGMMRKTARKAYEKK